LSTDEVLNKAVDQVFVVMGSAQKRFFNSLGDYLANKNIALPPDSKGEVQRLFVDAFETYLMAEIPAFLSFVLHDRLNNADILNRIVPEFLDACEARIDMLPAALAKKTEELPGLAKTLLESGEKKSDVVESLCLDLAGMAKVKSLRASFDALLLTLWGE
jgi:hypothetical protein